MEIAFKILYKPKIPYTLIFVISHGHEIRGNMVRAYGTALQYCMMKNLILTMDKYEVEVQLSAQYPLLYLVEDIYFGVALKLELSMEDVLMIIHYLLTNDEKWPYIPYLFIYFGSPPRG